MTTVAVRARVDDPDGTPVPVEGQMIWQPTKRRVSSTTLILPAPFTVKLPVGDADIVVAPSTASWVWQVTERFMGVAQKISYYAVPDTATVNYTDLVEVDPATLAPTAEPEAAWWLALDEIDIPVSYVDVVTGNEARPVAGMVIWVGAPGVEDAPVNMAGSDLFFKAGPVPDTTAPSAPTNVIISAIGENTLTVSWTASTDNVAVTGYDVYADAALKASVAGTTADLSGLTAATQYSFTVRAKDAVGNVSAPSAAVLATTLVASGTPKHSIWYPQNYPVVTVKETGAPLTVANSFYSYGVDPDVSAWRVVGARIWLPTGVTISGTTEVSLWFGLDALVSAVPDRTETVASLSEGWNEVLFSSPVETNAGDVVFIGYKNADGHYLGNLLAESGFITALDGSPIVLSESVNRRAQFMYDGGAIQYGETVYSIDVIYDEGPA